MIYNTIIHPIRIALWLNNDEYCILDTIDQLSNKPRYPRCRKSKENIGNDIGITSRSVFRAITKLTDAWFIEKEENWVGLRTTHAWYARIVNYDKMSQWLWQNVTQTMTKCHTRIKENNKRIIYNKDNDPKQEEKENENTPLPPSFFVPPELIEKYGQDMVDEFTNYRTETKEGKGKQKRQLQQTFEISKRLITRHKNSFNFKRSNGYSGNTTEDSEKNNTTQKGSQNWTIWKDQWTKKVVSNRLRDSHNKDYTAWAEEDWIKRIPSWWW